MKKECLYCHREFEAKDKRVKYCSKECKEKANAGVCVICGKPTKQKHKTCSKECYDKLNYLNHHNPIILKKSSEHIRKTKEERYGDPNYNNREKSKQTCLDKYGSTTYISSEEGKQRFKETMLEKYGVEHALQYPEFKQKLENTIKQTGISYRFHTPEWEENMLKKYGTTVPYKNEIIRNKGIQTLLERYGVTSPTKLDWVKEKSRQTCLRKYGVEYSFQSINNRSKSEKTFLEKYGMSMQEYLHKKCKNSKLNEKFAEKYNIASEDREIKIKNKYFDFRINNYLVELDPTVTHNSDKLVLFNNSKPLDKNYHKEKTKLAAKHGFRCIHIWDWDDENKILHMISDKPRIFAKDCDVILVDKQTSDNFLDLYHLQNHCEGDYFRIGLVYNNDLVGLMTFGIPRYSKKHQLELLRLCFSDWVVVGGVEKMFSFFIKTFDPESIVSYCDLSKFNGDVYSRLGFKLQYVSQPSAHWYNEKSKKHITDNLLRQRGFDQLFNTAYGKGTSNEKLMLEAGFVRVYDCGQATYVWRKVSKGEVF